MGLSGDGHRCTGTDRRERPRPTGSDATRARSVRGTRIGRPDIAARPAGARGQTRPDAICIRSWPWLCAALAWRRRQSVHLRQHQFPSARERARQHLSGELSSTAARANPAAAVSLRPERISAVPERVAPEQLAMRTGCGANGSALPVHRLFAEVAAVSPDAVAVICEQDRLTYAALDREANRLAFLLHRFGVGRAGVVAFLLPRSVEAIVAMLAVLKVGGTFVPLDPGYPPAQLADIVADCAPVCVLAEAGLMATFGLEPPWHAPTFIM